MLLRFAILIALAAAAFGATSRLYLKDGDYQIVREYQVLADRVRYFSTERGDWEEIPLELVDLDRTKKDAAERQAAVEAAAKEQDVEDQAIRAERKEAARVPVGPGVYYVDGEKIQALQLAETSVNSSKGRTVLKVLSPVPIVPGKSTVELKGETAAFRPAGNKPEFYFRLSDDERFAIIRLSKKKNARLVENVAILPVTNEVLEDLKLVATFKKQVSDRTYKIWPEQPLEPGEYALVQYSEGALNWQVWDFGIGPAGK
ncbi:MAG TPA: hypothetical protein VE958_09820 [Bryobacteraceae bacterium]|jgi:hypothetical protein|nr:hypothetical protein [Bryobacteraceae bacterium]